jgi:N-acetylglucosaminyl-diphospho-decaprenol L-rhamnosyltransferase
MSSRRTAVVTVTHGSPDEVVEFIHSLKSADGAQPGVDEIVVVDNLSNESEAVEREASAAGARVIRLPQNVGYGRAANAGERSLDDEVEFVLISNPDVRVHPGAIAAMEAALIAHPEAGAVGPKILNEDETVYPSARQIPSLRAGIGHALLSRLFPHNPWTRAYRQEDVSAEEPRVAGWLSGACLMVRRTAFCQVGGFDDGYFMYFEDVDLGYRLSRAGWTNRYEPSAKVTHLGATTTSREPSRMLRVHHRSADRFLSSKYRGWYLAPLRWSLHVGLEVRARWLTRGIPHEP